MVDLVRLVVKAVAVVVVIVIGIALTTVSPILTVVVIAWLVLGSAGWLLGTKKGHGGVGLFLGVLLGPIGLVIVAVMEPTDAVRTERHREQAEALAAAVRASDRGKTRTCPWCAETIKAAAIVCRHCGRDIAPSPTPSAE